jgi:hypothetical protein
MIVGDERRLKRELQRMRRYVTRKKVAAGDGSVARGQKWWSFPREIDGYSLFRVQLMGRCVVATAKRVFFEPSGALRVVVGRRVADPWKVG